jgi:hypothetical protein
MVKVKKNLPEDENDSHFQQLRKKKVRNPLTLLLPIHG